MFPHLIVSHSIISVWKRTASKVVDGEGEEERQVREKLESFIASLEAQIEEDETKPAGSTEEFLGL